MSLLGNILWIVLAGGWITCLEYLFAGLVLCLTIIGIPFGLQCFKMAELALTPFGRQIIPDPESPDGVNVIMNLLWFVFAGLWIALSHVVLAICCAITIIGIPFALQHLKLAVLGVWPFGKKIV